MDPGAGAVVAMLGDVARVAVAVGVIAGVVALGFAIGRWWALLLSPAPVVAGAIAYPNDDWPLLALWVPPLAVLLWIGVLIAWIRRRRARGRARA